MNWQSFAVRATTIAVIVLCSSCGRQNKMEPLPPCFSSRIPEVVPVILLGDVVERSHAAGPAERSEWTGRWTQLWTVRVRVGAVLQGDVPKGVIDVFYYPEMEGGSFPQSRVLSNLYAGHSELFFLQPDSGKLRTICDGWRNCIMWVRTGSHDTFQQYSLPLKDAIVRIFVSRGDHTTDSQIIDAIYHPDWRWGIRPVYEALQELAKNDKSPQVRTLAEQQAREILPQLRSENEQAQQ